MEFGELEQTRVRRCGVPRARLAWRYEEMYMGTPPPYQLAELAAEDAFEPVGAA